MIEIVRNTQVDTFKIQRSLFGGSPIKGYTRLLIYNKSRRINGAQDMKDKEVGELFDEEYKIYVRGKLENGTLIIEEQVEPQKW